MSILNRSITDIKWDATNHDLEIQSGDIAFENIFSEVVKSSIIDLLETKFDESKRILPEVGFEGHNISIVSDSKSKQLVLLYFKEILDSISHLILQINDMTVSYPDNTSATVNYNLTLADVAETILNNTFTFNLTTKKVTNII